MSYPETVTKQVRFADEDHVWISNKQYISLNRFFEAKSENIKELQKLNKKVEELAKENEALKILLKDKL